tara:strand:+ start:2357 stop:2647 length:291 start_codon:yes stop_codon:yes gene_type:complete
MGRKSKKKEKVEIPFKDKSERVREVVNVIKKLQGLGLNDNYEGIEDFKMILKQFVEDGIYKQGKVDIIGTKRQIYYMLFERSGREISIELKYNQNI